MLEYNFGNDLLTVPGHSGRIALYPTLSELRQVTRRFAQRMAGGPLTYSEFIKGNVVITVYPELSEENAERFRRALDTLK